MKLPLVGMARSIALATAMCLLLGCGLMPRHTGSSSDSPKTKYAGPAYYYFAASRIQLKQGQLDRAILLLQKAI
jgi:hypothetical protein